MRVGIAADHGGFSLEGELLARIGAARHAVAPNSARVRGALDRAAAGGGQHFLLNTGTLCVLGYYREIPAVRIWNGHLVD
jgi:hypothetical protein